MFITSKNKSSSLVLKPCKSVQETSEEGLFIKTGQISIDSSTDVSIEVSTAIDRYSIYRELRNLDF